MKLNKFYLTGRGVFLLILAGINPAPAQISTGTTMTMISSGEQRNSATDILQPHLITGRFGPQVVGGYYAPVPGTGRLADDGAVYSPSGGFLGMSNSTPNSRFGHYWELSGESPQPLDNSDLMLERMKRRQQEEAENYPQQVSAVRQPAIPARTETGIAEAFPEQSAVPVQGRSVEQPFRTPEQVWMRNPLNRSKEATAPLSDAAPTAADAAVPLSAQEQAALQNQSNAPNAAGIDYGSRFIGGISTQTSVTANQPVSFPMTAQQVNPVQVIQERLELAILQSPQVNLLSPVQVLYQNGQAVVRGIVPTEASRVEAGRILLSDPNVSSVDNRLTVLPADMNAPLPQAFDPNLPQTAYPSGNSGRGNSAIVEMPDNSNVPSPLDTVPQQ